MKRLQCNRLTDLARIKCTMCFASSFHAHFLAPPCRGGYVLVAGADLRLNDLTGAVATAFERNCQPEPIRPGLHANIPVHVYALFLLLSCEQPFL